MARWRPYHELDLAALGVLPDDWLNQVRDAIDSSMNTLLTEASSTSRERQAGRPMAVRVVDGLAVAARLPWLIELYAGRLKEFCEVSFGRKLFTANRLHTTVNINEVSGR